MSNGIIRTERALQVHGVEARAFNVVAASDGRILNQTIGASREFSENGVTKSLRVELRFDDDCKNGHETFSITGSVYGPARKASGSYYTRDAERCGCLHEDIARVFPEFAPLIKWHLVSTDGPPHYIANALYMAGDRDHNGLRKGETRQLRNGKTGALAWIMKGAQTRYHDGDAPPAEGVALKWEPWLIEGEGKARELDAARSVAVWPEATDAELSQDSDALRAALEARLPALLADFKAAMTGAGFLWPERKGGAATR